ncbi:carbon-nitrogen hydrolase family protein [Methanosphaera sp. WGK6]|uniref:carbon-nitrogen hydrolase family protein n=1 Tax=Methanosphaera sp. WGK6 TaxID=1561964 RepID=UPI00084C396C|nr:carbon-nitrogen hydrolase family protein [Methanosphaera sp. WGK6]OED29910.1 amidohydrolase [Methanosphaera sp. WGK6]
MKLALAQMSMSQSMDENYEKSLKLIRRAAKTNADLICFPEVQLTQFFPQYMKLDKKQYSIELNSEYITGMCDVCRENNIHASPNFYILDNGKYYDMSLLIDNHGQIIGKQNMVHIAQCKKFYEQDYYTPSEEGFNVFNTQFGKIGIVVCFDRHYPESIRTQALRGTELIIIPTANTTEEPEDLFEWEIKIQAFQNSVNIAMCNRVGVEDEMNFYGKSVVSDYNGKTIAIAGTGEELLFADVDLSASSMCRKSKYYTSLRRKEFYE